MEKSIESIELTPIVSNTSASVAKICAKVKEQLDDPAIVAIGLCPDEDVRSMFWMMQTREGMEERKAELKEQFTRGDELSDDASA
ncbi:MAG: hypothetical protein AAF085_13475 [Planctomycetota bacterium]